MSAVMFDTLAYARRMEQVGFTREQAEAMAQEQAKLIDERLATKADLEDARTSLSRDIEALRLSTKSDIEVIRRDIEALRLSTKSDIETLRLSTKSDIEALRQSTKSDIEVLRRDIVIRVGGIVIASVAAGSAIVILRSRLPVRP